MSADPRQDARIKLRIVKIKDVLNLKLGCDGQHAQNVAPLQYPLVPAIIQILFWRE